MTGTELLRWYWLKSELIGLARVLHVATSGSKEELTTRLVAALDGQPLPPTRRAAGAQGHQLSGDLSSSTVIAPGQRSSQELRSWFRAHAGPSFRFDRHMRDFIGSADGTTTLGDALEHWWSTRKQRVTAIDPQFELNRFTRAWYATNLSGTHGELLTAWRQYRSLPVEERDRS